MFMNFDPRKLSQTWPAPSTVLPIVIFGAGSIVADAHLPAYRKGGFPVRGVFDPDIDKARALAADWDIAVFETPQQASGEHAVIFDLATPPDAHLDVLHLLPEGAPVLLQKPMGSNLAQATSILQLCRARSLHAAVNFQLRFAPMMLALNDAIAQGWLGEVVDFDAWLALDTPWHLWQFLESLSRVEIAVHSIHYFDFVRRLLGNPDGVHAKTLAHPRSKMAQSRTAAILDYGQRIRCSLSINHDHFFGRRFQACEFRICGTEGAAYVKLGVNLDYPRGEPDELWIHPRGHEEWLQVPLQGAWFPDAFVGRMANLQRSVSGEDSELISAVEDAWQTMALVEAAYESSASAATALAPLPATHFP